MRITGFLLSIAKNASTNTMSSTSLFLKAKTKVKMHEGRPAVFLGVWFFVDKPIGTEGIFIAHKYDQFAYLKS
jgi:hypothetical protein